VGAALATIEMQYASIARAVPIGMGVVVLVGGFVQFTEWKAKYLACCREGPDKDRALRADAGTAWRHGVRLGLLCGRSCANLMAILVVVGLMDVGAMAAVTAAISAERLAPSGARVAPAIGIVGVSVGIQFIARAAGLG